MGQDNQFNKHRVLRILSTKGMQLTIEFCNGEKRIVDLGPLTRRPGFGILNDVKKLVSATITADGDLFWRPGVSITGPTLYHMAEIPIPPSSPEAL